MGCHGSKQSRRNPSPLPRSKSLPGNRHTVSLTSSTLGSLSIDATTEEAQEEKEQNKDRSWPEMIDRRAPRTPTVTPPSEPEPVDALELMAGFHGDCSPLYRMSFSFYAEVMEQSEKQSIQPNGPIEGKKGSGVVLYFTTLRGIRKTYDDSCSVKAMLREYSVRMDERDVSMHSQFREELKEMSRGGMYLLPRVFVDGRDLGGAEEVMRMHEAGELAKVLEKYGDGLREKGGGEECEACGDVRFVLCGHCSGSRRVYTEEEEEEEEETGGGWRQCLDCNENGIVRCPVCS